MNVVTRFAPSPTGHLHIGGARTALFNYAFAKKHGGTFILRIEDTDQSRSSKDYVNSIDSDLEWLGLKPDEGPFFQSDRIALYNEYVERLIVSGHAYIDPKSNGKAVYFKVPNERLTFNDMVLGDISGDLVTPGSEPDFVIRREDGFPTYNFACVVDDATMGITHVFRGQEHITNTPRQILIYKALGYQPPQFGHLPLILNSDGSKMSKRDKDKAVRGEVKSFLNLEKKGFTATKIYEWFEDDKKQLDSEELEQLAKAFAVTLPEIEVRDFKAAGYLPEVLVNYISLLGWSPPDKIDRFDLETFCKNFNVERIGRANAQFDRVKLKAFNAFAINAMGLFPFTIELGKYTKTQMSEQFMIFCEGIKPRVKTLAEAKEAMAYLSYDDDKVPYQDKIEFKLLPDIIRILSSCEWTPAALTEALKKEAPLVANGSLKEFGHEIRVAVLGKKVGPPLDTILFSLPRERILARLNNAMVNNGTQQV